MQARRQSFLEGWYLLCATSLTMAALALWLASMRGFEVDGVRMVVRYTARTSLLFFCLAFSASALHRLWPSSFTRWQRLCLHHRHGGNLVRRQRPRHRPARMAHPAQLGRLLSVGPVHDQFRDADSGGAELCLVPGAAAGGDGAA